MGSHGNRQLGVSEWYLVVRDGAGELRIVARNGTPLDWRPLSNVFRGPKLRAAQRLVTDAMSTAEPASGAGFAVPVHLQGVEVMAALLSLTDPDPDQVPLLLLWQWEFRKEDVPPVLHMSESAASVWGLTERIENRGPADFYTGIVNLQDVLTHLNFLYDAPPCAMRRSTVPVTDNRGGHTLLEAYEVVHDSDARRTVSGIAWQPPDLDLAVPSPQSADAAAWEGLVRAEQDRLVVVTDMRYGSYPYVVRWMSPRPTGMTRGLSQGVDKSVLHAEDVEKLRQYAIDEADRDPQDCPRVIDDIRVRHDDGGWISGSGRGFRLDPRACPTVWLWVLDISIPS